MKKLLAVFAHPDDESFGPAGTIARYAATGVEVHLLTATRGEAGVWQNKDLEEKNKGNKIHYVREEELLKSASVLGIKSVEFMDYEDGRLCNALYHEIAGKIIRKINDFKPQVILTVERLGVSGHLDHIAISMITTYSFLKTKLPQKLYYHCMPRKWYDQRAREYFVYFPEGYEEKDITTRIDFSAYWDQKEKAMLSHKSQRQDALDILKRWEKWEKTDHFILQYHRNVTVKLPETDLFAGIS
jgi:N-acetylglucosamine malate deacetylase 2